MAQIAGRREGVTHGRTGSEIEVMQAGFMTSRRHAGVRSPLWAESTDLVDGYEYSNIRHELQLIAVSALHIAMAAPSPTVIPLQTTVHDGKGGMTYVVSGSCSPVAGQHGN